LRTVRIVSENETYICWPKVGDEMECNVYDKSYIPYEELKDYEPIETVRVKRIIGKNKRVAYAGENIILKD